jgi:hypothetical protein
MNEPVDTFCSLWCARNGLTPAEFEVTVLAACVYPQARWLLGIWPSLFAEDLILVRELGSCTDMGEFKTEWEDFRINHPAGGFLRGTLKMRLSGQLLTNCAGKYIS